MNFELLFRLLVQGLVEHAIYGLLLAGGYYMIRYTKKPFWGWGFLFLLALAVFGAALNRPDDVWKVLWGIPYVVLAEIVGRVRKRRAARMQ